MSDRQELLQNILDNPDDDMARRVFSDWLEEHGEMERAEFIRVDIANPLQGRPFYASQYKAMDKNVWPTSPLYQEIKYLVDRGVMLGAYLRGFVYSIELSSADWFTHHAEILSQHPLKEVRLSDRPKFSVVDGYFAVVEGLDYRFQMNVDSSGVGTAIFPQAFNELWPRVTFHLPEPQYGISSLRDTSGILSVLERLLDVVPAPTIDCPKQILVGETLFGLTIVEAQNE